MVLRVQKLACCWEVETEGTCSTLDITEKFIRDHLEDLVVDVKIILKGILSKYDLMVRAGFMWFRIRTIGGRL
jgi:hypothetical protein